MRVHAETERWTLYQGDVLEILRALPEESVQCVVTSPPYYGLRDYGLPPSDWPEVEYAPMAGLPPITIPAWTGCLGLEPTPEAFVGHLVAVFREARRVLRSDGTLWLNLGDSFNGSGGAGGDYGEGGLREGQPRYGGRRASGLKAKDLVGIPWRVAFALQADGWWLRSDIVWAKRAPMPESVTDRPTRAHEFVFLLTKSQRYYYDAEALREPGQEWPGQSGTFARASGKQPGLQVPGQNHVSHRPEREDRVPAGRNARDVWLLGPDPYPDAHFATFPRELPRRAILAGGRTGDAVLDPFAGSGTTLEVAVSLGRRAIGIELSGPYCDLVVQRMARVTPALPGLAI